jgi:hypothetical protein
VLALSPAAAAGPDAVLEAPMEVHPGAYRPTFAFDGEGGTLAVWWGSCGSVVSSRSTDNGVTWTPPRELFASTAPSSNQNFDLAFGNDTWGVVWQFRGLLGASRSEELVMYARSVDDGASWTEPTLLSPPGVEAWFPAVATDGLGNWVVVWRADEDIMIVRSVDDGASWTSARPLGATGTDIGFEIRPDVAADHTGTMIAVWAEYVDSFVFDVRHARSTDAGVTWSTPAFFPGESHNNKYPSIAADGLGNWMAVWDGFHADIDRDVHASHSRDGGQTWTVALPVNTNYATDGIFKDDERARVASDGHGNWLVAWRLNPHGSGGTIDVLGAISSDLGRNWTDPGPLHSGDTTSSDLWHDLIADGRGNWLVSWTKSGYMVSTRHLYAPFRLHFSETCASDLDGDGYGSAGEPDCPLGTTLDCDETNVRVAPAASDLCDGQNNDCSDPAWPLLTGTNESDDDGDGFSECGGDCDDDLDQVWLPVAELELLLGQDESGTTVLMWNVQGDPGALPGALRYDIFRHSAAQNFYCAWEWLCLESDSEETTLEDADAPDLGTGFYYLVRSENICSPDLPLFAACP